LVTEALQLQIMKLLYLLKRKISSAHVLEKSDVHILYPIHFSPNFTVFEIIKQRFFSVASHDLGTIGLDWIRRYYRNLFTSLLNVLSVLPYVS
jgi:hypothetical protein